MKHVVFDKDETLVNFNDPFLDFVAHTRGLRVYREHVVHYDLVKILQIPQEILQPMFHEFYASEFVHKLSPYPGMPELLESLRRDGYKISVLTARPARYRDSVVSHVHSLFPGLFASDDIHVVGDEVHRVIPSKLERARALDSQILIDDAQHHLFDAPSYRMKGVLANWNHPCNRSADRSKFYAVADSVSDLRSFIDNAYKN